MKCARERRRLAAAGVSPVCRRKAAFALKVSHVKTK